MEHGDNGFQVTPWSLEILYSLNPMRERGLHTIFEGYIDESFGPRYFSLTCLFAKGINWRWVVKDWEDVMDEKNRELSAAKRKELTRFHAAECSSRRGEFAGWTVPEQTGFMKKLLGTMGKPASNVNHIAFALDLNELQEVIPETARDPLGFAYGLLIKMSMLEIGAGFGEANENTERIRMTLIQDRNSYPGACLSAFEAMKEDTTFKHRHIFTTLAPIAWEDCPILQPCDLIAFEAYKEAERQGVRPHMDMRKSLAFLLSDQSYFRGRSKGFNRENLEELKALIDRKTATIINAEADSRGD